jgi:hypothetical protein
MRSSSTETEETTAVSVPPSALKVDIWILLGRVKIGIRQVKGWVFRGGPSRRLNCSVGKRDSCEMRKLFGGHERKK